MGMSEKLFKGETCVFDLNNNNNKHAFKSNQDKSVSTWQSGELDRTTSFKSTISSIDLI